MNLGPVFNAIQGVNRIMLRTVVLALLTLAASSAIAGDFIFFAEFEARVHPVPGAVIVNESMPHPSLVADTAGEWIELANVSSQTVDVGDCTIGNGSTDNVLPTYAFAPGFAVLAHSTDPATNGGITAFATFTFPLTSSGTFYLDCDGREIDHAPWVTGIQGQSFSLYPDKTNASDNNVVASWCFYVATTYNGVDYGTPGDTNGTCPSG